MTGRARCQLRRVLRSGVFEATQNAVNCVGTERHRCIMRRAEHEVQLRPQFRRPTDSRSATGIRRGAADAHRIQMEEEKTPRARPPSPPWGGSQVFCHWTQKRKRLGKTPSRFKKKCCDSFIQRSYFSPALPLFKSKAISSRLEVVIFRRARACAFSAAQAGFVLRACYETTLFRQQRFFDRSEVRVVSIGFG